MTLDLNPAAIKALEKCTAEAMELAEVIGNSLIIFPSMEPLAAGDLKLPQKGPLADQLRSYIGERPFSTFASHEIDRKFVGQPFEEGRREPLTSYPSFKNPKTAAAELVSAFSTLPWDYVVSVRLPDSFKELIPPKRRRIAISPRHEVVFGQEIRGKLAPVRHALRTSFEALLPYEMGDWDAEAVYLLIFCSGFVADIPTETFYSARDEFLAFAGLGIALDLIRPYSLFEHLTPERVFTRTQYQIHASGEPIWPHLLSVDMHLPQAEKLKELRVNPASEKASLRERKERIRRMGVALSHDGAKRIQLASKWLFESYCGRDALQQFIQAAVAIEILLGDGEAPKDISLNTLMANRCAYLVGRTPQQRDELVDEFREIYKVRSKIVHTGKSRLSTAESKLFFSLQKLCARVIKAELALIDV